MPEIQKICAKKKPYVSGIAKSQNHNLSTLRVLELPKKEVNQKKSIFNENHYFLLTQYSSKKQKPTFS